MTYPTAPSHERGAASIEFAFTFVLIVSLFYGMIGYFLPLLLASTYQEIAVDAVREAALLTFDSNNLARQSQVASEAVAGSWLPEAWAQSCSDYPAGEYFRQDGNRISACIGHSRPSDIFPTLSLFGWRYPVLPEEIRGEATLLRFAGDGI